MDGAARRSRFSRKRFCESATRDSRTTAIAPPASFAVFLWKSSSARNVISEESAIDRAAGRALGAVLREVAPSHGKQEARLDERDGASRVSADFSLNSHGSAGARTTIRATARSRRSRSNVVLRGRCCCDCPDRDRALPVLLEDAAVHEMTLVSRTQWIPPPEFALSAPDREPDDAAPVHAFDVEDARRLSPPSRIVLSGPRSAKRTTLFVIVDRAGVGPRRDPDRVPAGRGIDGRLDRAGAARNKKRLAAAGPLAKVSEEGRDRERQARGDTRGRDLPCHPCSVLVIPRRTRDDQGVCLGAQVLPRRAVTACARVTPRTIEG